MYPPEPPSRRPWLYVQRAAVNEDSCDRVRRVYSLRYSQVIIIDS